MSELLETVARFYADRDAIDFLGTAMAPTEEIRSQPEAHGTQVVIAREKATAGCFVEGYVMTETARSSWARPWGPRAAWGRWRLPSPSTDVRVVDPRRPGSGP